MRKFIPILSITSIFLILFSLFWVDRSWAQSPPVIDNYADINYGNDSTGDGSISAPWKTLHHAVGQINNGFPGATFILHVASGTYSEANGEDPSNILITQSKVTVTGDGVTLPVIQGGGTWVTAFEIDTTAVQVTINHLEITNFNSGGYAIIVRGNNATIENCYIHDNYDTAILVSVVNGIIDNVSITRNRLANNQIGIYASSDLDDSIQIGNNLIYDSTIRGIHVDGKAYIYHNTIDGDGVTPDIGVYIETGGSEIKYNILTGLDVGIENNLGTPVLDYNNLWDNTSDYINLGAGSHDISQNPQYTDRANGNLLPHFKPHPNKGIFCNSFLYTIRI